MKEFINIVFKEIHTFKMNSRLEKILVLSASAAIALAATNTASYFLKKEPKSDSKRKELIGYILDHNFFDYAYSIYFGTGEYLHDEKNESRDHY